MKSNYPESLGLQAVATSRLVTAAAVSQMRQSRTPRPTDFPTSLPPELQEVLVGCTLGDLSILRGKRSDNARLQFWQGIVNAEYLMHLYSLFESYCGSAPKVYTRHSGKANVYFNTLTSPVFTEFNSLFYLDGVKHVPANIGELLTARSLAYWAMDDGCSHHTGFYLCTDSFAYQEVKLLSLALQSNFGLDCTVQKYHNVHRIYICARSILWSASGLWFGLTSILL